jgi:hypothetical protein
VGQEAQHSERGRTQDVDRGAETIEGLQDLVRPASRHAFALADRVAGDRQETASGARAADAVRVRIGVDLAAGAGVDLEAQG